MNVRERLENWQKYKSKTFTVQDPVHGRQVCRVHDFYGRRHDGSIGWLNDHPALSFDVLEEEIPEQDRGEPSFSDPNLWIDDPRNDSINRRR